MDYKIVLEGYYQNDIIYRFDNSSFFIVFITVC